MKKEVHSYDIYKLSNDNTLTLDVITYDSEVEGPHIYFQANVHGAELQGNLVIKELMNYFTSHSFKGKITFVPFANPLGSTQTFGGYTYGRFNPRTGDNWNRNYLDLMKLKPEQMSETLIDFCERIKDKNIEEIRNHYKSFIKKNLINYLDTQRPYGITDNKKLFVTLQSLASDADYVFDLHTGSKATRYLYAAEYEKDSAKNLLFPHTLLIPNEFAGAMDEATFTPWVELHNELDKRGITHPIAFESYTIELGSEEYVSTSDAQTDALRILHFLKSKSQHNNNLEEVPTKQFACFLNHYKSYYSPHGGLCEFHLAPSEHFKKDQLMASIHSFNKVKKNWETTEIKAQQEGIVINHCSTANVGEGQSLFQVMEAPFVFS